MTIAHFEMESKVKSADRENGGWGTVLRRASLAQDLRCATRRRRKEEEEEEEEMPTVQFRILNVKVKKKEGRSEKGVKVKNPSRSGELVFQKAP
jgi:hypothetical protein